MTKKQGTITTKNNKDREMRGEKSRSWSFVKKEKKTLGRKDKALVTNTDN